ncbi:hypothetical protein L211DRAFT_672931 [Terfezia boudieri ATCC MYA-4762]|uniref:Protein kinase domain-containing protein n=1 Tax=Terfezia boudieri ATCC MYA-4762 TaxID=1051890 RepID=A0A3N4LBT6_9PEZI|nr:hypothetical protein L211DRAFT_672931 [Terfezia boudieri ATCC MYA-4762]
MVTLNFIPRTWHCATSMPAHLLRTRGQKHHSQTIMTTTHTTTSQDEESKTPSQGVSGSVCITNGNPWRVYQDIVQLKGRNRRWHATNIQSTFTISEHNGNVKTRLLATEYPEILKINEVYSWQRKFYIVTRETPKSTLQMALTILCGKLKPPQAINILHRVLLAIQYLWEQGVSFFPAEEHIYLENDRILVGNWWVPPSGDHQMLKLPAWARELIGNEYSCLTFTQIPEIIAQLNKRNSESLGPLRCLTDTTAGVPCEISDTSWVHN